MKPPNYYDFDQQCCGQCVNSEYCEEDILLRICKYHTKKFKENNKDIPDYTIILVHQNGWCEHFEQQKLMGVIAGK